MPGPHSKGALPTIFPRYRVQLTRRPCPIARECAFIGADGYPYVHETRPSTLKILEREVAFKGGPFPYISNYFLEE